MNNFQLTEILGVTVIICLQFYIFFRTMMKIFIFRDIFPGTDFFEVIRTHLKREFLQLEPKKILQNLKKYIDLSNPPRKPETEDNVYNRFLLQKDEPLPEAPYNVDVPDDMVDIELIGLKAKGNDVTNNIFFSINTYLLRNKGVASDFHLIKDISERNCDAAEDSISQTISLPLYLGLLGTFLGIVVGLFQISGIDFASDPSALDSAISLLLGGVKIAMIASFTGLLLTVINNGYFLKNAKAGTEARKNDFYTFIQTELLPLLNQNINSTLYSLQNNLHKFNDDFKVNVSMLSSVMGKNYDSLIAQEKILSTLDKMDITAFAKANLVILQELNISTNKLSEFNRHLSAVNQMVINTGIVTVKINDLMDRTSNFNSLSERIITVFEENRELSRFLQNHYSALDESHQKITMAVNEVGATLEDSLIKLKEFTQERIREIQKITLNEISLMQSQYPEKWKKLDDLHYLQTVDENLRRIKDAPALKNEGFKGELADLRNDIKNVIKELEKINSKESSFSKLLKWVKKI